MQDVRLDTNNGSFCPDKGKPEEQAIRDVIEALKIASKLNKAPNTLCEDTSGSTGNAPPADEMQSYARAVVALAQAREYVRQGKNAEAVDAVTRAFVPQSPFRLAEPERELAAASKAQAAIYAQEGQEKAALDAYRLANDLDPSLKLDPNEELRKVLVERGRELGGPAQTSVPGAEEALALGRARAVQGDAEQALAAFRQAVKLDPKLKLVPELEVALTQGRAYAQANRIDDAVTAMQRAIEISPTVQLAESELARSLKAQATTAFSQKGDYNEVLLSLRQAAEFDPASQAEIAQLCVDFGRQYAQQSQIDAALAAFRLANELDPNLKLVPEDEVARIQREQK